VGVEERKKGNNDQRKRQEDLSEGLFPRHLSPSPVGW